MHQKFYLRLCKVFKFSYTVMDQIAEFHCIYSFGVLRRFQHCTGHITMGSWKGRGNQYIQLVKVLYCKLLTNSKQLPAFPLEVGPGTKPRSQRWEARVLPLCHCITINLITILGNQSLKLCLLVKINHHQNSTYVIVCQI